MWNHRIILKKEDGDSEGCYYEIHEVYYNEDGTIWAITEESVKPFGDTVEDLKVGMKLMLTAFEEPVLIEDDIVYVEEE